MPATEVLEETRQTSESPTPQGAGRSRWFRAAALTLVGLGGVVAGVYGLLDGGSAPLLGLPLLLVGVVAASASLGRGCLSYPSGDPPAASTSSPSKPE